MHGIVALLSKLREVPSEYGLITANGGFLSKHAAGKYSKPVESVRLCLDLHASLLHLLAK
jgi:hypothetical protein